MFAACAMATLSPFTATADLHRRNPWNAMTSCFAGSGPKARVDALLERSSE
jgi:hypothetical protein